jgi:hypothetical protein
MPFGGSDVRIALPEKNGIFVAAQKLSRRAKGSRPIHDL